MKFKIKALILVSIILVSSLILYYTYTLVNKPKFKLEKSAEYINEFGESVTNVQKVVINGSEYYTILMKRKIVLFDALGNLVLERDIGQNVSFLYVNDLDFDESDELIIKYYVNENVSGLEIFESNLRAIGNVTYHPSIFKFEGFVDCDGDGFKDFIFIEKSDQSNLVTIHGLNRSGNEVLKYQVTEVENYVYFTCRFIEIEDSQTKEKLAILFVTFIMKTSVSYTDVYKTHILFVSRGKVIQAKTYDIGPVSSMDYLPLTTHDFDGDGFPEIFMVYKRSYSYSIGILFKNGNLRNLMDIDNYSFTDINSYEVIVGDLDSDLNKEVAFAFGNAFDKGFIIVVNTEDLTVNSFKFQVNRPTIVGVIGSDQQHNLRLIYSSESYIFIVSFNGTLIKSLKTPLKSISYSYICDLDLDGKKEISLIGHADIGELIVILSESGEVKKTLEVSYPFYNWYYARREGRYSFLIWYKSYVDIYLDSGDVLNVFNVDKNVPHTLYDSQVIYVDLNNDGINELIAVDESTLYIYFLYNKSIKKISVPRGDNIKIFSADIDGDSYKDIIIYNQFFGQITGISLKYGKIFRYHFNTTLHLYDLVSLQYDNDAGEELGLLLSGINDSYIFIVDNNGSKLLEVRLNVSDINIMGFDWATYYDSNQGSFENGFLLAYKIGKVRYKFIMINSDGEIIWSYDHISDTGIYVMWDKVYIDDFDADGSTELAIVRLSKSSTSSTDQLIPLIINVSLEYIDIPDGFLWEIATSLLDNVIGFSATVSTIHWRGERYIGFAYALTRTSSYNSKIIAKYQLLELNGEKIRGKTIETSERKKILIGTPAFSEYENRTYCILIKESLDLSDGKEIDVLTSEISSPNYASLRIIEMPLKEEALINVERNITDGVLGIVIFINDKSVLYLKIKK